MQITSQRRLAAQLLKCGEGRVWLDQKRLEEIKQAITRGDIRHLINDFAIQKRPEQGVSHARFRKRLIQRRKGRQQGSGTRKGKRTARLTDKTAWISRVRVQREFLRELRDKKLITGGIYHLLYRKSKGGFFRSKRHIKLYIDEHTLIKNEAKKKTRPSAKKA